MHYKQNITQLPSYLKMIAEGMTRCTVTFWLLSEKYPSGCMWQSYYWPAYTLFCSLVSVVVCRRL